MRIGAKKVTAYQIFLRPSKEFRDKDTPVGKLIYDKEFADLALKKFIDIQLTEALREYLNRCFYLSKMFEDRAYSAYIKEIITN